MDRIHGKLNTYPKHSWFTVYHVCVTVFEEFFGCYLSNYPFCSYLLSWWKETTYFLIILNVWFYLNINTKNDWLTDWVWWNVWVMETLHYIANRLGLLSMTSNMRWIRIILNCITIIENQLDRCSYVVKCILCSSPFVREM